MQEYALGRRTTFGATERPGCAPNIRIDARRGRSGNAPLAAPIGGSSPALLRV
jgi:hypothetical protein